MFGLTIVFHHKIVVIKAAQLNQQNTGRRKQRILKDLGKIPCASMFAILSIHQIIPQPFKWSDELPKLHLSKKQTMRYSYYASE